MEIRHKVFFSQSPREVWEYITKPELIELWLMKNDLQPIAGQSFQFWTKPMPNYGFDGNIYCTVLEVIPFQKLSYTWKGGPGDGSLTLDSVVVWTLVPKDNGTELQLVHSGFRDTEDVFMYTIMNDGWLKNMNEIAELIKKAKDGTTNVGSIPGNS